MAVALCLRISQAQAKFQLGCACATIYILIICLKFCVLTGSEFVSTDLFTVIKPNRRDFQLPQHIQHMYFIFLLINS